MKTEKTIWQKSREELFQELSSTPEGLTGAEAARRLEHYGPNELQEGGRKSVLRIFLEQFADFLVIILILAAVVSAILGDVESMAVILAVITTISERDHIHAKKKWRIFTNLFTFPIFMISYVPITVAALFKKVEWVPTKHDIAVNFDDVMAEGSK